MVGNVNYDPIVTWHLSVIFKKAKRRKKERTSKKKVISVSSSSLLLCTALYQSGKR